MPTFSRQALRRALGQSWLRDTHVGTTTATANQASNPFFIIDSAVADAAFSGQQLHAGTWLYAGGNTGRVGSFHTGSGAYYVQTAVFGAPFAGAIASGADYERHAVISPDDKNRALDDTLQRLRIRQEVGITTVSGARYYDLDAAASPHRIADVLDAYVFADPSNTGNRDRRSFSTTPAVVGTATGIELRIDSALDLSALLVVDALLELTLGSGDTATVNIPDERWVLSGAAAKCWDLLAQKAPGTNARQYEARRDDAARTFSDLSARYKPPTARKLGLSEPF